MAWPNTTHTRPVDAAMSMPVVTASGHSQWSHRPLRQCARRPHFDLAVADARLVVWLRKRRWSVDQAPVLQCEAGPMPWADDTALLQRPLGERPAQMRADVVEGVDHAALTGEQHRHAANLDTRHLPL